MAGLLFVGSALASQPRVVRQWQTKDGLPQTSVTSLIQSRSGYIWFGTYAGLVRFDGVRFTVFDSEQHAGLANDRITALFEGADGVLWIGHETGDVTRYDCGQMTVYPVAGGLRPGEILEIAEDAEGGVWALSREGWLKEVKEGLTIPPAAHSGEFLNSHGLAMDSGGTLWCLRGGELSTLRGGRLETWVDQDGQAVANVQAIQEGREDGLWVAAGGRVRKMVDGKWMVPPPGQPWSDYPIGCMAELKNGGVVVGTREAGLFIWTPDAEFLHFNRTNKLAQDWVRCVVEDREGALWVGLGNGGLCAIQKVDFEAVNPPDHWFERSVLAVVAARDGAVWAGTEGAGLYRLKNGQWSRYLESEGLLNRFVWSVCETPTGELYVGTWSGGLFVLREGKFIPTPGLEHLTVPVCALLNGDNGELWMGTAAGVGKYKDGQVEWLHELDGVRLNDVRCMVRTPDGTMWFGMNGDGLARLQGGKLKLFRKADGLGADFLSSLHLDSAGVLWIGTAGAGLVRYANGVFARIGSRQGLPSVNLAHIEEDELGNFWIGSSAGVLCVSKAALNACADGKVERVDVTAYGLGDGLETLECSGGFQPSGCRTADGYVWFPTRKGLVRANPATHSSNPLPPPVVIERFLCQGKAVDMESANAANPVRIPPGRSRFEFEFTALSFLAPERVRFQCRLRGLEEDWVEEQTARNVVFNYLPPGDYIFEVAACNNDGVWNMEGARLAFTVLPHFWQTLWFRVLLYGASVVLVGGAVWLEARRRLHRKLQRLEQQRALERERARIAKDIHDDLGASLTRITMLSHTARQQLDTRGQAEASIDRIQGTARELTRSMDEIVWAVNPRYDTLDSLAAYIFRFAQDFLGPAGIRCRVDVPLELPKWPIGAELRHNVFLACKEAINNVVRHSQAREVKISLVPGNAWFTLCVEDDGGGLDRPGSVSSERPAGGNGLRNMKSRMDEIGGRLEISGRAGGGTVIQFEVPVSGLVPK